jgi:hypothetical protein
VLAHEAREAAIEYEHAMALSMHQISIPVFTRALRVLSNLLDMAAASAAEKGTDPSALINARLAPDMLPLSGQIQRASDTTKLAIARLAGVDAPPFADNEKTFAELKARLANTIAFFETVDAAKVDGSEDKVIQLNVGKFSRTFRGDAYLLTFVIPNLFFHVTTAYDILRHNDVNVGKLDYLGPFAE